MFVKQHTGFRCMLLGIIFLFFNCVCTAASVIKITPGDYKHAIALQLAPPIGETETEEENQLASSSYINRATPFKKQHLNNANNTDSNSQIAPGAVGWQQACLPAKCFLPAPGYYTFLFRYNLF